MGRDGASEGFAMNNYFDYIAVALMVLRYLVAAIRAALAAVVGAI
jgi:hypothetical protein